MRHLPPSKAISCQQAIGISCQEQAKPCETIVPGCSWNQGACQSSNLSAAMCLAWNRLAWSIPHSQDFQRAKAKQLPYNLGATSSALYEYIGFVGFDAYVVLRCFKCPFVWRKMLHWLLCQVTLHCLDLPKLTLEKANGLHFWGNLGSPGITAFLGLSMTQGILRHRLLAISCTFSADGLKLAVLLSMKILWHLNAVLARSSASVRSVVMGFSINIWKWPIAFMPIS